MDLQLLRDARRGQPFQPFVVRLASGRELRVNEAFECAIGGRSAAFVDGDDAFVFVEPEDIFAIEPLPPAGGKRNRRKS